MKAVALDKTGTITRGNFVVAKADCEDGFEEGELIELAAALEAKSTHPIAHAIVSAANGAYAADSMEEVAGCGVKGSVNGKTVLAGNSKHMKKENISYREHAERGTTVYVAVDGKYAGCIVIDDTIKPQSKEAVAMMKKHRPNAKEVFTMTKQIKKDEGIRLADGRMATLSAAQLPDGKFEVMLFTNGPEMEEVDSIQCEYEETALAHFERLKKYYHTPELKGRYKKLAEDLKEAKAYGMDHAGDDDGGTCNFDSATLYLPRWNKEKVEIAAKTAGVGCSVWTSFTKCCFIFSIPGVGQGFRRTKAAEAMHDFLEERGYDAGMYYQMD